MKDNFYSRNDSCGFLDQMCQKVRNLNVENSHIESTIDYNQSSRAKLDVSNLEEVQVSLQVAPQSSPQYIFNIYYIGYLTSLWRLVLE